MTEVLAGDRKASELPVHQYYSDDFYEAELRTVWRDTWLLVGRASEVPDAGDYFVFDLQAAGTSLLVVRGRDGRIRAFYNACSHHGARLSYRCKGSCERIRCSFHGWVYDFEGRLRGVPFNGLFTDLDTSELGLREVRLDTWGGFIFVHLGERPRHDLHDYLQPLPAALGQYLENEDWRWFYGYKGTFKANWKIFVDNQCEGHHANFLHRRTIGGVFALEDIPHEFYPESPSVLVKIAVSRPAAGSTGAVKQSEVTRLALQHSKAGMWTEKDATLAAARYPGAVNVAGSDRWVFDLYVVFPNLVFLFEDDQFIVQRVWPLGPELTAWELDHYFVGEPGSFAEEFNRELSVLQELDTVSEDTSVCEGIHRNFESGAVNKVVLSDLEAGVGSYQRKIMTLAEGGDENS